MDRHILVHILKVLFPHVWENIDEQICSTCDRQETEGRQEWHQSKAWCLWLYYSYLNPTHMPKNVSFQPVSTVNSKFQPSNGLVLARSKSSCLTNSEKTFKAKVCFANCLGLFKSNQVKSQDQSPHYSKINHMNSLQQSLFSI